MNRIKLAGCIISKPEYSHTVAWEKFYKFQLETYRTSGTTDVLNCIVSETMVSGLREDLQIEICGEIRTRNEWNGEEKHCRIEVFVFKLNEYSGYDANEVEMHGFICKKPYYRETPLGREICDLLIASNRERVGKSDYIPSICWKRLAQKMQSMPVGTEINVIGRLQSREYTKKLSDDSVETRIAYELSCNKIFIEGEECYES